MVGERTSCLPAGADGSEGVGQPLQLLQFSRINKLQLEGGRVGLKLSGALTKICMLS